MAQVVGEWHKLLGMAQVFGEWHKLLGMAQVVRGWHKLLGVAKAVVGGQAHKLHTCHAGTTQHQLTHALWII